MRRTFNVQCLFSCDLCDRMLHVYTYVAAAVNLTLPICVCSALRQVTRAVTQLYDDALRPSGLRAMQFFLLMNIRGRGSATISDLVEPLMIDQTTLTRSLRLLEREGWVRQAKRSDKRLRAFELTARGDQVLRKAEPLWASVQSEVLQSVDAGRWDDTRTQLARLAAFTQRKRPGGEAGPK